MLLKDKVCVVTGLGPGLGREISVLFAQEGASVVIGARTESYVEEVAAEIAAAGGKVVGVPVDITDRSQCERILQTAADTFGGVDVVLQNGFMSPPFEMFEDADLATWRTAMNVNLWGSLELAQAAVPHLKSRGGGSIVFVGSMIMRKVLPFQGGYAISKGALNTAMQLLARELGQHRIRVNSIVPGWMMGPSVDGYFQYMESLGKPHDELYGEIASNISLGVIPTDDECARAALFLASDLSVMVTGAGIDVNGGEVFH
ncbi:MAG: SDR family oxidoreductase [Acidimicrobiia bacterium]|jgi:NAD(P)-dependent dehydrogenase (short-subunit alcohol dehydrogenase family)